FSSRRRHTRFSRDWSSDVCSSDLIGALTFALGRVQILGSSHYALIAKENRLRPVIVRSPRGTIYDRHGRVVAENTVGYQVLLMPAPLDSMRSALERLQPILGLRSEE